MNYKMISLGRSLYDKIPMVMDRPKLIAIALGMYLGTTLSVPATSVTSPEIFYNETYFDNVSRLICDFNESIIVSRDLAGRFTKNIWKTRYNAFHPLSIDSYSITNSLVENIFGVGVFVSEEDRKLMTERQAELIVLFNIIRNYYKAE